MSVLRPSTRACLAGLALVSASIGISGCSGRPSTHEAREARAAHEREQAGPAIITIDLTAGAPEVDAEGLLSVERSHQSFASLVTALKKVTTNDDARGVFVKFGDARLGLGRAEEIGALLAAVKAKLPVYCHANGLGNDTYAAAAEGCSKIWLSPAGGIDTVGIAAQLVYAHKLLADELHLSIDILQVGKYKGAEEPLTRDGPSDEARASLESTLADLRHGWLDIVRTRGGDANATNVEDGPYSAERAHAIGMVDEVGYGDEAFAALKTASGASRENVTFGPSTHDDDDLAAVLKSVVGVSAGSAPVALVRASGSIGMTGGGGLGSSAGIYEDEMDRTFARLERDDAVKAVVLRIDSPGGSALASDLMWHRLMRLRAAKPLVVSIGDMAASGGFYLASTGLYIYADAGSIVGSIGVVGGKVSIGDALGLIGVHAETFAAKPGPEARNRAAFESILSPWDDPTRARVLESMRGIYDLFLARVSEGRSAEGRSIGKDRIAASAEGRIFGGREGKNRGLVDEIGGLDAALAKARDLAHLPANARVQFAGGKESFVDKLTGGDRDERSDDDETRAVPSVSSGVASGIAANGFGSAAFLGGPELRARLLAAAPEIGPFAESLLAFGTGERALTALPYGLRIH